MNSSRVNLIAIILLAIVLIPSFYIFFRFKPLSSQQHLAISILSEHAIPFQTPNDLNPLIDKSSNAKFVLLGESSHGNSEYYYWRSQITQKLISQGFSFIAVEGDWAAIYQLNQYIKGLSSSQLDARKIMSQFSRWPTWMWANKEFLDLVEWLRDYNQNLSYDQKVGLYGKDLYGASHSMKSVINYYSANYPDILVDIESAYSCLLTYQEDYNRYLSDLYSKSKSCESEVSWVYNHLKQNPSPNQKDHFNAQLNALVVKNAELHYRRSLSPGSDSWNYRALHMKDTINRLTDFYGPGSRGIIWAHNTHIGDARATQMIDQGSINLGQLLRQKYSQSQVYAIGFAAYAGQLISAISWGDTPQIIDIPPAVPDSYEALLAQIDYPQFLLFFDQDQVNQSLLPSRGHRAKGVVYNPYNESQNYILSSLPDRYDALIYFKQVSPLTPLIN